jgi:hypothetical protein
LKKKSMLVVSVFFCSIRSSSAAQPLPGVGDALLLQCRSASTAVMFAAAMFAAAMFAAVMFDAVMFDAAMPASSYSA